MYNIIVSAIVLFFMYDIYNQLAILECDRLLEDKYYS